MQLIGEKMFNVACIDAFITYICITSSQNTMKRETNIAIPKHTSFSISTLSRVLNGKVNLYNYPIVYNQDLEGIATLSVKLVR